MSRRKTPFVNGSYYHLYNRGNSRQDIFRDNTDYLRFQSLLYIANGVNHFEYRNVGKEDIFDFERGQRLVHIGAYCLMPNHFHILLTPACEHGVQNFMQKLATSYSMYFNQKYERTGSLFEGKFKSQHVAEDRYMKYLFAYVHLNPVKLIQGDWKNRGLLDVPAARTYLDNYNFSSFKDYYVSRKENCIIEASAFPEYFKSKRELDAEMLDWLTYGEYA